MPLKTEMQTKNQLISALKSTQILTQDDSHGKKKKPDCEDLISNSNIEKRSVVRDTHAN